MKKLIITLIVLAVIVTGTIIGVKIYKDHRKNSNPVSCTMVSFLSTGFWENGDTLDGNISETGDQKVYIDMTSIIDEVKVKPGQNVSVGDLLLTYDMTRQQLAIDSMKTQLEVYITDIQIAERQLDKLYNTTPLEDMTTEATTEVTTEATTEASTEPATGETGTPSDAAKEDKPNPEEVFKEHPDWVMYPDGSFGPITQNEDTANPDDMMDPDNQEEQQEPVYDRETLKNMIADQEEAIKKMKNNLEIYKIKIEKEEKKLNEGNVYATINGVVKSVDVSDETISTGQPIITISSNSGYKTEVYVSEWKIDDIKIGDPVNIYSYESGGAYTGKVSAIDRTPAEDYGYYDGGTASRYPVTIVIDEPCDDLAAGYWVQVTMGTEQAYDPFTGESDKIYLPMPYVREENGNYYVLCNNNGKLKKRYVKTGKIVYGYAIEIKEGLSMDDYIAFPYGKDVTEGKKCINTEGYEEYY